MSVMVGALVVVCVLWFIIPNEILVNTSIWYIWILGLEVGKLGAISQFCEYIYWPM